MRDMESITFVDIALEVACFGINYQYQKVPKPVDGIEKFIQLPRPTKHSRSYLDALIRHESIADGQWMSCASEELVVSHFLPSLILCMTR